MANRPPISGIVLYETAHVLCPNCKARILEWTNTSGFFLPNGGEPEFKKYYSYRCYFCPECSQPVHVRNIIKMRCPR